MDTPDVKPRPEREETDSSLQSEREKADRELTRRRTAAEAEADQVVELARERADDLLDAERHAADGELRKIDPARAPVGVAIARASADERVVDERAADDEKLEEERVTQKEEQAAVLEAEREETDAHLLLEREHADRVVATRDEFLAIVSHEMRGMLSGMKLSAELLMATPPSEASGERVQRESRRIQRCTQRMNRLIGDLLDVVSMEAGKLHVLATHQDATRLLAETLEIFGPEAASKRIRLTSEVSHEPLLASFDHQRLLQVLSNLVGNALRFTPAGGSITLRLWALADGLELTVRDSGCGIAADQLELVFERFARAASSDGSGFGLGLYIARCIVDAHGGRIWVDSEVGKGSAFHVRLSSTPLAQATSAGR
jgi:signal transduction histidine kinase